MPGIDWLVARPIAHRGLHGQGVVENTLGAVAAAMAADYAVEVDLMLSADGEAVVFHDDTLDRLTEATGLVASRSLAELKSIPLKRTHERIPALADLLNLVAGRVPLVLELKSDRIPNERLVTRVAGQLADYSGPVAVMSFDPRLLVAVRQHAPGLPRGIVAERHYRDPGWGELSAWQRFYLGNLLHLLETRPHFVAYWVRDLPALAPLFARYALGMPLLTWTVRTEAERERARRWANQMIFEEFLP
jgi:glycerophosphoryl diester phosphodiesterase